VLAQEGTTKLAGVDSCRGRNGKEMLRVDSTISSEGIQIYIFQRAKNVAYMTRLYPWTYDSIPVKLRYVSNLF
jgi:hypothetical protein